MLSTVEGGCRRADAFNANISSAVTGEAWRAVITQRTGSPQQAFDVEQAAIRALKQYRSR
jgi:hypothetical protein